jgi:hypothetical protein
MKQVTKVYNVYTFEELSKAAQSNVKDKLSDVIVSDRFEWLKSDLEESLKASYDIDGDVFYSLCNSQGDGLHFDSDNLMTKPFYELMLKVVEDGEGSDIHKATVKDIIKVFYDHRSNLNVFSKQSHHSHRYCYASKDDINIDVLDEDAFIDLAEIKAVKDWLKDGNPFKIAVEVLERVVSRAYLTICSNFEDIGYKVYDVSDEDVKDLIESNGYEFNEDGSIF